MDVKPLESEILQNLRKDRFGNYIIRKSQTEFSEQIFRRKNKIGKGEMSSNQSQLMFT